MEEEIITPEEETFNYKVLRYILDKNGYLCHASLGGLIICDLGECTEYKGEIPSNYETIEEWYDEELDRLNAWKIVDGDLVFDDIRCDEIKEQRELDEIDNACVTHKELYGLKKEIEDIQDVNNSQYTEASASGKVVTVDNVKKVYPKLKLTNINPYSFDKIDLFVTGKNMLPNEALTQEIAGVSFTQNEDRSITIDGKATEDIEYSIAGTNINVSPILMLKKDLNYYLSSNGYQIKMYNYDGTDKTEVYGGSDGVINFTDEDKIITQITLFIPKDTTIDDVTIYPQLEFGSAASEYETFNFNKMTLDFSEYVEEGLFPSDDLFPNDDLFPAGTTIDYILIDNGKAFIKVNGEEEELDVQQVHLFDGYDVVYTLQDTFIEMDYCINNLKLEGVKTKNNNFKVLPDGSIEAHNGYFSGTINGSIINLESNGQDDSKYSITDRTNANCKYTQSARVIKWTGTNGGLFQLTNYHTAGATMAFQSNDGTTSSMTPYAVSAPTVTQTSREESKKNIEPFNKALEEIKKTDIYKYNLKFEDDEHKKHLGFVIGENYNYSSEITSINEDGEEIGVDNYSMTSLCLQAIKELLEKVDDLENKIKEMEVNNNGED